jgi:hypothetical protein
MGILGAAELGAPGAAAVACHLCGGTMTHPVAVLLPVGMGAQSM